MNNPSAIQRTFLQCSPMIPRQFAGSFAGWLLSAVESLVPRGLMTDLGSSLFELRPVWVFLVILAKEFGCRPSDGSKLIDRMSKCEYKIALAPRTEDGSNKRRTSRKRI